MKDNVLVLATDEEEHDKRLKAVFKRLAKAGTTLNPNKCSFKQPNLRFFRHVLTKTACLPTQGRQRLLGVCLHLKLSQNFTIYSE